jgi:hypothetical protein
MKSRIYSIAIIFVFFCCKKEKPIESLGKSIIGNWNCISGIELINNDTVDYFQNGIKHQYWGGKRYNSYTGSITLQIDNINYHFLETMGEGYIDPLVQETYDYSLPWKLLNTTKSNTFINLKSYLVNPGIFLDIFKIVEITDNTLILENDEDIYYAKYIFERINELDSYSHSFTQETIQNPQNILGDWNLTEYYSEWNDSVYSRFINDTLTTQFYNIQYPKLKQTAKYNYSKKMKIMEYGVVFNNVTRGNVIYDNHSYWYWTDTNNPHKSIYISDSFDSDFPSQYYEISSLTDNELILKNNDGKNVYKYLKE